MPRSKRIGLFLAGGVAALVLLLGGAVTVASRTGTATAGAATASRTAPPESCEGYNAALEEAAALARRIGKPDESARFLSMRQACTAQTPAWYRATVR